MKDEKKAPKLRFKGFTDDWVQRKLENIFNIIDGDRGSNYPHNSDFLENGTNVFLDTGNVQPSGFLFNTIKYISDEKDSQLRAGKMEPNDIVITSRGTLGNIAWYTGDIVDRYPSVRINSAMLILRNVIPNEVSTPFMISILRGNLIDTFMRRMKVGSAQPHITKKDFSKTEVSIPSNFREQESLGMFFETLDNLIAANQRKLAKLKELKQGYLQKMFPKNGVKVPELRFAGFADDWEERKLGTIYDFGKGKGLPLDSFIYSSNNPAIAYGHLYTKYSEVISEVFWSSNDNGGVLSKDNDLLFPGSSTVPNGTAQANAITLNNVKLGGDIIIGRPKEGVGVLSTFMSYQVNSQRQKLFPITVGTTITHMYGKDVSKLNFFITDYSEQEKIASFFKQLDDTIALHQRKLDLLKEQKKGFLQKMFV